MNPTTLLAIETSCDETGVAIVRKTGDTVEVLAEAVASQIDVHAVTGGVVPEVAAREHVQVIHPMVEKVMKEVGLKPSDITAIAVTVGPGLMPALAVGVVAAKTLSYAWQKPIVPVHHIEGHLYSALLSQNQLKDEASFPLLALVVSGGHTMLIEMKNHLSYEILGTTQDDAAGEAFDKVARLLGLSYPGGPNLNRIAKNGNPKAFAFPRPMLKSPDYNFSFSGLKTSVLYKWREVMNNKSEQLKSDVAASFQAAVIETLVGKTKRAIGHMHPKTLLLAGGVAANEELRNALEKMVAQENVVFRVAPAALCGDNAVMIGQCGVFAYEAGRVKDWSGVEAMARFPITDFSFRNW